MPRADPAKVKVALEGLNAFLNTLGANDEKTRAGIAGFVSKVESGPLTKELRNEISQFNYNVRNATLERIYAGTILPGKTKAATENALFNGPYTEVAHAVDPPPPSAPKLDIKPFIGDRDFSDTTVRYYGDVSRVGPIVSKTVEVVERFAGAIRAGDFSEAYSMISPSVRGWLTQKRLMTEHKNADARFGGEPTGFSFCYFTWALADEAGRRKSPDAPKWPKDVDKQTRRSAVVGYWTRPGKNTGCWVAYKTTEENNQYYIAQYEFFLQ